MSARFRPLASFTRLAIAGLVLAGCDTTWFRPAHFSFINGEWKWVGRNAAVGRHEHAIGADPKTFAILDDPRYAKDVKTVFYRGGKIVDADPASFEIMPDEVGVSGRLYSRDRYHVFLDGKTIPDADPATYRVIQAPFGRDATNVYCGTLTVYGADPATFTVLTESTSWSHMGEPEHFLRHNGPAFAKADVSQERPAILTTYTWSRDSRSYFYNASRVEDADYETFQLIDTREARDKNGRFICQYRKEDYQEKVHGAWPLEQAERIRAEAQ
jgi:hypothetical protein